MSAAIRSPRRPIATADAPVAVTTPAATLGQYNEEVLSGVLGLSKSEIDAARARTA